MDRAVIERHYWNDIGVSPIVTVQRKRSYQDTYYDRQLNNVFYLLYFTLF